MIVCAGVRAWACAGVRAWACAGVRACEYARARASTAPPVPPKVTRILTPMLLTFWPSSLILASLLRRRRPVVELAAHRASCLKTTTSSFSCSCSARRASCSAHCWRLAHPTIRSSSSSSASACSGRPRGCVAAFPVAALRAVPVLPNTTGAPCTPRPCGRSDSAARAHHPIILVSDRLPRIGVAGGEGTSSSHMGSSVAASHSPVFPGGLPRLPGLSDDWVQMLPCISLASGDGG